MSLPRAALESLLQARHLDRTLTSAIPAIDPRDEYAVLPTGITAVDECLGGGFPRGQLSELVGPRSSGRLSVLLQMAAAATRRGELVALIDLVDMLDVESAAAAGVDFARLLWVRGSASTSPGACRDAGQRRVEQALRALTLVVQSGGFGLVVFDAGEAPPGALARLPQTTWLRVQRMVEGSQTVCAIVARDPVARSAAGLTLQLGIRDQGLRIREARVHDVRFNDGMFKGIVINARVIRARTRAQEDAVVAFTTRVHECV